MNRMKSIVGMMLVCLAVSAHANQHSSPLWYKQPAKAWVEALPLGNGRLGAMVFGGTDEELIQLNEETLWSGRPADLNPNPEAISFLPKVREALFREDLGSATELCKRMQGNYTQSYLPLGDLKIKYRFPPGEVQAYYRDLDIAHAVARTRFRVGQVGYEREVFVSAPDQTVVVKLRASAKGMLNFTASLSSLLNHAILSENQVLVMKGEAPVHVDPSYLNTSDPVKYVDAQGRKGMRFAVKLAARVEGGSVRVADHSIQVSDATEVILILSAATSFNGFNKDPHTQGKDESLLANTYLQAALKHSYFKLKRRHIADYQSYFNRVSFHLNDVEDKRNQDILERLLAYREGASDRALEVLYFHFNRYLLISSSRVGGLPANLQGIWNHLLRAPWSSNYTMNINAEMNYWPAESCHLSDLHLPFLEHIEHISQNGQETAANFYQAKGWALSHNSDIWGQTNPVGNLGLGDPTWANWYMGSPWASQHLYEHYRFTNDQTYLKEKAYPIMRGAALFCLDWLVEDGKGHLVTAPSTSPENYFITENGKSYSVSMASTMDMSIIWDLFTNLIEASEVLDTDMDFRKLLIQKRAQLYPLQIGKRGGVQEWFKDFEERDPHHRHVSHLFGLHPGRQITPFQTPDFALAARKTLELRGDNGTGWSLAWKINFWARLLNGNHAYKLLRNLLHVVDSYDENYDGGGSYPNLFCAHPPFQIDGNFGGLAGMTEMLLQSHLDEVHLLPALPTEWKSGTMNGLCARKGFVVDMAWKEGLLSSGTLYSTSGMPCVLRTSVPVQVKGAKTVSQKEVTEWGTFYVTRFPTQAGKKYKIICQSIGV